MSAEAHNVLEDHLTVIVPFFQLFAIELNPETAELTVRPVRHKGNGSRIVAV